MIKLSFINLIFLITCMFSQTHQALVDIIKTIRSNYDIPI